jgi:hypothetical protein
MAFIPIPNTVLVRLYLKTAVAELKASVSVFFSKAGFTVSDMEDLLDHLASNFVTDLMDPLCDDYNAYLLEAYDMTAVDGYKVTKAIDIDGGSATLETPVSPALSCVVTFRGNKRGKWNSGRNFVAGLWEGDVDQVDIGSTTTAAIISAYQSLIDDPPTGWQWVIASRYFQKAPRAVGVTTPVETVLVRSARFGVQRRRTQRP